MALIQARATIYEIIHKQALGNRRTRFALLILYTTGVFNLSFRTSDLTPEQKRIGIQEGNLFFPEIAFDDCRISTFKLDQNLKNL